MPLALPPVEPPDPLPPAPPPVPPPLPLPLLPKLAAAVATAEGLTGALFLNVGGENGVPVTREIVPNKENPEEGGAGTLLLLLLPAAAIAAIVTLFIGLFELLLCGLLTLLPVLVFTVPVLPL